MAQQTHGHARQLHGEADSCWYMWSPEPLAAHFSPDYPVSLQALPGKVGKTPFHVSLLPDWTQIPTESNMQQIQRTAGGAAFQ